MDGLAIDRGTETDSARLVFDFGYMRSKLIALSRIFRRIPQTQTPKRWSWSAAVLVSLLRLLLSMVWFPFFIGRSPSRLI
mmetsp:Transcript_26186/g.45576  ORF Transcript_26186/g.45576 Transcript_26186/m.45576 type:complete len:80 (-) Transcript_26186:315-554(-)